MSGLGLHPMASLRVENGPSASPYHYCYRGLYGSAAEANGAVAATDSGGRRLAEREKCDGGVVMAHGLEGGVERGRLRTMAAMASDDSSAGN